MQAPAAPGGGGASGGAGASAATFKVQCVGLVKTDPSAGGANPVLNVLRGMCLRYETFERLEYGFVAPKQSGTDSVSLRLFRHKPPKASSSNPFAPPPPTMWTLVHESTPMRGPVYAALPATVREVAESNLYTRDAVAFVEGLGARMEYAVQKNGNYYVCSHQGLEIQVVVYSVAALARGGRQASNLTGKHWMLEATAEAGSERQVEVARLMGSFAERLLPHVELKRPA